VRVNYTFSSDKLPKEVRTFESVFESLTQPEKKFIVNALRKNRKLFPSGKLGLFLRQNKQIQHEYDEAEAIAKAGSQGQAATGERDKNIDVMLTKKIKKKTQTVPSPPMEQSKSLQQTINMPQMQSQASGYQPQSQMTAKRTVAPPPMSAYQPQKPNLLHTLQTPNVPKQQQHPGYYPNQQMPMQQMFNPYMAYDPNAQMYAQNFMGMQAMNQQGRMQPGQTNMMYGMPMDMNAMGMPMANYEALMQQQQALLQQQQMYYEQMMGKGQQMYMQGRALNMPEDPNAKYTK
jgi:hypothetical protein